MADESDNIPRINVESITTDGGSYHVVIVEPLNVKSITTEGGSYDVVVVEPQSDKTTVPIILVAPITWAWVAMQICAGILQAIGGAIFSAVFGKDGVTKKDLRDLLEQFVAVIEAALRRQIQLDKKEEYQASAASLQSLFNMYINNKDITYLTPLIFKADDLVYQFARLRLLAVGSFAVVASLELAIIQEESLVKKNDGKNIAVKANEFIAKGAEIRPALEEYNKSRFSKIVTEVTASGSGIGMTVNVSFVYYLDGQRIWVHQAYNEATAESYRQAHIGREFARLEVEILHPLYAVIEKWREIVIMRLPIIK